MAKDTVRELTRKVEALEAFVTSLHIELQQLQKKSGVQPLHWWAGLYQQLDKEEPKDPMLTAPRSF